MKALKISFILVLMACHAWAARDALGVFFRPDKTLIAITDNGPISRLQKFFKHLDAKQDLQLVSADQSFKMDCVRDVGIARCQFRLTPSTLVHFTDKKVESHLPLKDLGLPDKGPLEISFASANGDRLDLVISDGVLHFYGMKTR